MSDLVCIQANDSARQEESVILNSFTIPSNTHHPQHHQISQTIFLCLNNLTTCYDDNFNREIIDISDDDEEDENENTCKNGTSIDDSSDEEEIEVIQLSDDDEDEPDDESSDENTNQSESTSDNHEINELFIDEPLDLTYKTMLQQQTTHYYSSSPSTSQTEPNFDEVVACDKTLITLGLTCSECPKLIDTRAKLAQHLMDVHDKLPFKCMIRGCNRRFTKRSLLSKHYRDHRNNQAKLICSAFDCQFETSIQHSFTTHLYLHHEKGLFQCSQCTLQSSHRMMSYNHYYEMHKHPQIKAQNLFHCSVDSCQYVGKRNSHKHQLTHGPLRIFRCAWPDCGYAMNIRSNLVKHIRAKHLHIPITKKEANQRNIICNQNPYEFIEEMPFEI